MKNQYFGDVRDLFKYDLCLELLINTHIKKLVFIPMLTPNDSSKDGRHINYEKAKAGYLRKNLVDFLSKCVKQGKRDISMLKVFFEKFNKENLLNQKIDLYIHKEGQYLSNQDREEHFNDIPKELLESSLILIDPDNGLEVKSKTKMEKYLRYSELKALFEQMDKSSVIMVFQYIPRIKRHNYFETLKQKIEKELNNPFILYVSDNRVVFFIIAKDNELYKLTKNVIKKYARTYDLLYN